MTRGEFRSSPCCDGRPRTDPGNPGGPAPGRRRYGRPLARAARLVPLAAAAAVALAASGRADVIYGVTTTEGGVYSSTLLTFDSGSPNAVTQTAITGPELGGASQFTIRAVTVDPATGLLYGLGYRSGFVQRLYQINPTTGVSTEISQQPFQTGSDFGFAVNPVGGQGRFSGADTTGSRNYTINTGTGSVTQQTSFAFATGDTNAATASPIVGALVFNNSASGASTSTLYGIETKTNSLVRIGDTGGSPTGPNSGQLHTVGALGVPLFSDVSEGLPYLGLANNGSSSTAFAALSLASDHKYHFGTVSLATGAYSDLGTIGDGTLAVRSLAAAVPEPATLSLGAVSALAAGVAAWFRRRRGS